MFDVVNTAFIYERELIICSSLQDFSKGRGNSLQLICNAYSGFFQGQKWGRVGVQVISCDEGTYSISHVHDQLL